MLKKRAVIYLFLLLLCGCARVVKQDLAHFAALPELEGFQESDRVLILAPHPDDEAIACAGVIQQALKSGAKVKIVYLTNGDHNELAFIVYEKRLTVRQGEFVHMGTVRQQEAIKAMKFLGLTEKDLVFLGYPDYGTFTIFSQYWQTQKPFRDLLTRISSVPYKDNPSYQAPYVGESILSDLEKQLQEYQPNKIFVSHPADVNVDHKSLYLFLQVALSDLAGKIPALKVYPYLVHCVNWPIPRHYHPELALNPPDKFLFSQIHWLRLGLSFAELDKKYQAIMFYRSQTQSSAFYLFAFARENELFGDYPAVDLKTQTLSADKDVSYLDSGQMLEEQEGLTRVDPETLAYDKIQVSFARNSKYFLIRLEKPKSLNRNFRVMVYLFGYSKHTNFSAMPKIRIITAGNKLKVFNARKQSLDSGTVLDFGKNALVLKVPLDFLGDPDYLLCALKGYHGNLPVDAVGFRKIDLK